MEVLVAVGGSVRSLPASPAGIHSQREEIRQLLQHQAAKQAATRRDCCTAYRLAERLHIQPQQTGNSQQTPTAVGVILLLLSHFYLSNPLSVYLF